MYFLHAINSDRQTRLLYVLGQIAMILGDKKSESNDKTWWWPLPAETCSFFDLRIQHLIRHIQLCYWLHSHLLVHMVVFYTPTCDPQSPLLWTETQSFATVLMSENLTCYSVHLIHLPPLFLFISSCFPNIVIAPSAITVCDRRTNLVRGYVFKVDIKLGHEKAV